MNLHMYKRLCVVSSSCSTFVGRENAEIRHPVYLAYYSSQMIHAELGVALAADIR